VGKRSNVDLLGDPRRRQHYQRTEQPSGNLRIGYLVGVIPERAGSIGDEAIGELSSDRHGVLSHACDAIHGVGDVEAVPVQRDACSHRLVTQMHLDQLTLPDADLRAG
jgi:hypothetical protein